MKRKYEQIGLHSQNQSLYNLLFKLENDSKKLGGKHCLNYDEFIEEAIKYYSEYEMTLQMVFDQEDRERKGYISHDQLKSILDSLKEFLSEQSLQLALKCASKFSNRIYFMDFIEIMQSDQN